MLPSIRLFRGGIVIVWGEDEVKQQSARWRYRGPYESPKLPNLGLVGKFGGPLKFSGWYPRI
jgi:hypothetical protein